MQYFEHWRTYSVIDFINFDWLVPDQCKCVYLIGAAPEQNPLAQVDSLLYPLKPLRANLQVIVFALLVAVQNASFSLLLGHQHIHVG
jgi:hypothetical protein